MNDRHILYNITRIYHLQSNVFWMSVFWHKHFECNEGINGYILRAEIRSNNYIVLLLISQTLKCYILFSSN